MARGRGHQPERTRCCAPTACSSVATSGTVTSRSRGLHAVRWQFTKAATCLCAAACARVRHAQERPLETTLGGDERAFRVVGGAVRVDQVLDRVVGMPGPWDEVIDLRRRDRAVAVEASAAGELPKPGSDAAGASRSAPNKNASSFASSSPFPAGHRQGPLALHQRAEQTRHPQQVIAVVRHKHIHVIPRYAGDVPDPRGAVRSVPPARARRVAERDAAAAGRDRTLG